MPANVEIKAILHDRMAAEANAAQLSDRVPATIEQEDIFFRCDGARLKLRILGPPASRVDPHGIARTAILKLCEKF